VTDEAAQPRTSSRLPEDTGVVQRKEITMPSTMSGLEELYVEQVNEAVAEGRMDLVEQLNDEYLDKALQLLLETS
jgi:hypothetical protein